MGTDFLIFIILEIEHFFQNLLFLTVIIPLVLFLTFSAFLFLLKRWEKNPMKSTNIEAFGG